MTPDPPTRLPHPPLLREFPFSVAARRLAPGDIRATAEQRRRYLRCTQVGDRPADAVVEMFQRLPPGAGRRMFELALEQGIEAVEDAPAELIALFAEVDAPPYWVDFDQLDLACRAIGRTGIFGFTSLSMLALLGGYSAARVIKPLVATGDLERMAPRRLAETVSWYAAVTAPGGVRRFSAGWKATLRVRIMHAQVRAGMIRRPDWNFQAWDHPLNQSGLAGTLMLFGLANIVGSQAFGLHFSKAEKAAIYHHWRYVGHLLGVAPDILPTNESDHWRLCWLQLDYEFQNPDDDSVRLARALIHAIGPMIVGHGTTLTNRVARYVTRESMCAYARLVLGRRTAEYLAIPDRKPFQLAVLAAATAVRILEYPRRVLPGATRWCEAIGRRSQEVWVQRMMELHRGDMTYSRRDNSC